MDPARGARHRFDIRTVIRLSGFAYQASGLLGCPHHAAESDVAHSGVEHLRLACGWAVTQAIVGGAQMGAALDDFAGNLELGLASIIALIGRSDARIHRGSAARLYDLVRESCDVPVARPFPDVSRHVVKTVTVWWE